MIYDLKRSAQTHSYTFPSDVADPTSCFLNDIVLHYVGGQVKYAYITDTRDAKLYVYNYEDNTSYFFQDPSMRTDNGSGYPIDGIAMSADFDYVYYCPIDGLGLFQVRLEGRERERGEEREREGGGKGRRSWQIVNFF